MVIQRDHDDTDLGARRASVRAVSRAPFVGRVCRARAPLSLPGALAGRRGTRFRMCRIVCRHAFTLGRAVFRASKASALPAATALGLVGVAEVVPVPTARFISLAVARAHCGTVTPIIIIIIYYNK